MHHCPHTHNPPSPRLSTTKDCSYPAQMQQQVWTVERRVSSPGENYLGSPQSVRITPPQHKCRLGTQMSEQMSSGIYHSSHLWDCHGLVDSDVKDHHCLTNAAQEKIEHTNWMNWVHAVNNYCTDVNFSNIKYIKTSRGQHSATPSIWKYRQKADTQSTWKDVFRQLFKAAANSAHGHTYVHTVACVMQPAYSAVICTHVKVC